MKKLLALLLCVMLLTSVISTSAFAASEAYEAGSGLAGAYQARLDLFAAFGTLATADAVINAHNGILDYAALYGADSVAGQVALAEVDWWEQNGGAIIQKARDLGTGLSPEQVFELVAPDVYISWENVGDGICADVAVETAKVEVSIFTAIAEVIAAMTA